MITDELIIKMTEFNAGDPKRIQHFIKVYEFAHIIGIKEELEADKLHICLCQLKIQSIAN